MIETILELTARAIAWLFFEIILQFVCYGIGKYFLKAITLGRHPKPDANPLYIQALGGCILITPLVVYTVYVLSAP